MSSTQEVPNHSRDQGEGAAPAPETPPTQSAPTQLAPTQLAPTQSAPTQLAPTQLTPTQLAPIQLTPTQLASIQSAPTTSPTAIATSVKAEPRPSASSPPSNGKASEANLPAEICVVIGGSRNSQAQGSYICGICGKKYKYYNCFQTHVRAHRETEGTPSGEGAAHILNNSFRYTCDICGKKYKYYSCFQEHRDLHAVDDPYDHMIPVEEPIKEEIEPLQKIGPKTGSYTCEYCGKQYKYFNPYQEHVALHTPMRNLPGNLLQLAGIPSPITIFPDAQSSFALKLEGKLSGKSSLRDGNNSQSSSDTTSPMMPTSFPTSQKAYTCGSCGIQFQFYNNLMEHMQSHAADNENHTKEDALPPPAKPCQPPIASQEQTWKSPPPAQRNHMPSYHKNTHTVRNSSRSFSDKVLFSCLSRQDRARRVFDSTELSYNYFKNRLLPEKERQQVAERLLRMMCTDLGLLSALSSKDFLKLAQTLVDTGSRHGAYSIRDALGDMSSLALKQLPRMYNQVKVKVTCALGSNSSSGIAVTCHSQTIGGDSCYVLTAYQVEGVRLRRYVLGLKEASLREGPEHVHHWVQNVLSEFVMSEIRTVYVTEPRLSLLPLCGRSGLSLRCTGCSLAATVQAVLGRRSLQARGLHELGELLATCRDIAGTTSFGRDSKSIDEPPPPPCWDSTAEALLKVHDNFEAICEAYGRCKSTAPLLQGLNKHLLGTLACLLGPLRQAAQELGGDRWPTLQQVLPVYIRLEKLFTSKAGEAGAGSKLCHYFLEALKENFKVERIHQVAMILDPQLKLRPVPGYQHEEIISRACDMAASMRESGSGGSSGITADDRDGDGPSGPKRGRLDCGVDRPSCTGDEPQVRKELFQYLGEPLFHATGDLFQYWSSVMDRYPKLSRLALWLLAVPAVGVRSECVSICEQTVAMKKKRQVSAEEMNKLVFLKCNFA
ncbi:zinc finger protein 618 isoform X3 [Astyanax mexicanus]|uniref:zinc finger protein 618 isoform X3 n=1 Tax=Astyanax mexicanus TaxID=7994 RepID=UPI0020CAC153|nr:zinc finger protein 618 isoform X3 [Astyanax mexicanus]